MIGITTTVPVEVILAAGHTPVDLNNRFVTSPDPAALVREAEDMGLARTLCAWIKGIYAWCLAHPEVETIVAVTQGDCSNTHALMELLSLAGRRIITFGFPHGRKAKSLEREIVSLARGLGADMVRAEEVRRELLPIRKNLARLDELTWKESKATGWENYIWQLTSSDFDGDPALFRSRLEDFLAQAEGCPSRPAQKVRLGLLGVPTIIQGLHEALDDLGADLVYNEIPRQFAMPPPASGSGDSLLEQYRRYTYPYDVFWRMGDIKRQAGLRELDAMVHYTQSFCHRQVQDIALRKGLGLPMLTLEGDRPGPVDPRTRLRLEAFIDVLR